LAPALAAADFLLADGRVANEGPLLNSARAARGMNRARVKVRRGSTGGEIDRCEPPGPLPGSSARPADVLPVIVPRHARGHAPDASYRTSTGRASCTTTGRTAS
jgi:hypothetical protein